LYLVWLASVAATTAVAAWKRRAIWWSRQVEPGKFADNTLEDVPASTDDRYLGYRALYLVAVVAWMAVKVGINWAYPNVDDRYTIPTVTSLSPISLTPHRARSFFTLPTGSTTGRWRWALRRTSSSVWLSSSSTCVN